MRFALPVAIGALVCCQGFVFDGKLFNQLVNQILPEDDQGLVTSKKKKLRHGESTTTTTTTTPLPVTTTPVLATVLSRPPATYFDAGMDEIDWDLQESPQEALVRGISPFDGAWFAWMLNQTKFGQPTPSFVVPPVPVPTLAPQNATMPSHFVVNDVFSTSYEHATVYSNQYADGKRLEQYNPGIEIEVSSVAEARAPKARKPVQPPAPVVIMPPAVNAVAVSNSAAQTNQPIYPQFPGSAAPVYPPRPPTYPVPVHQSVQPVQPVAVQPSRPVRPPMNPMTVQQPVVATPSAAAVDVSYQNRPFYEPIQQVVMENPQARQIIGDQLVDVSLSRPFVQRTEQNGLIDTRVERPSAQMTVLTDGIGTLRQSDVADPQVHSLIVANEIKALLEKYPAASEILGVNLGNQNFRQREMKAPTHFKIEVPNVIDEEVADAPQLYDYESDSERFISLARPFAHDQFVNKGDGRVQQHIYREAPSVINAQTPRSHEVIMEKPYYESREVKDSVTRLGEGAWASERPLVYNLNTTDATKLMPLTPMEIDNGLFRWGALTGASEDYKEVIDDDDDNIYVDEDDALVFEESQQLAAVEEDERMEASAWTGDEADDIAGLDQPLLSEPQGLKLCPGLKDFPIYYINLQKQPNRRRYMEETFGTNLNRVGATNGTNLLTVIDKYRIAEPENLLADPWGYLKREYNTSPGELGALISHLDAIKTAFQDKHETVLILEDDIGAQLCPYWPASLEVVKKQADKYYPGWHSIQLQWTPVGRQSDVIKNKWREAVLGNIEEGRAKRLDVSYGSWDENTVPLLGRISTLHGNAATLWSRTGLKHVLQKYQESIISRTRSGLAIRKWKSDPTLASTPDAILHQYEGAFTLFSAPPLFAQRAADDTSALKNDLQWRRHNLFGSIFALQWYLELQELYRPAAALDALPLKHFEFTIRDL